jgi:endo-1,4-beta-xylanase
MTSAKMTHAKSGAPYCLLCAFSMLSCQTGTQPAFVGDPPGANTTGLVINTQPPCPAGAPPVDSSPTDAAAPGVLGPITPGLSAAYAGMFPIGAAISATHLTRTPEILEREFNHLTAENDMKFSSLQAAEGSFTFEAADKIANFARQTGKPMTGHTLIWHRQSPSWLFSDLTAGDAASIEQLKERMRSHIDATIGRYADVVDNWDVVNEAISDTNGKLYRDAEEGSDWYRIFGDEEYVYWGFKFAYDALEANAPGSAAGKLYYNDYNETLKVDRIIQLLDGIRSRGVPVDGVGLQGHYRIGWPSIADLRVTIEKYITARYQVKISELDVSIYDDYSSGGFQAQTEGACTDAIAQAQAQYYASLFALFREFGDHIHSVTFWGISDEQTWLDNEPVSGRNDYPLLWNDEHEAKAAYYSILP